MKDTEGATLTSVKLDTIDHLQRRASQLRALTVSLIGSPGFENFQTLGKERQNDLLWLIDDLVEDIHDKLRDDLR